MAKHLFRLWLCLFALPSFAGNIICTNADFTGNPQTLRVVLVYYLDAPTSTYTNIITRDRLRYTNDSTGYFIVTNYYPGNYRFEFQGVYTPTTNWFNFPATNGTVNAADPQWGRGPTNGIVQALTVAAGDARYAPIGLNHSNRVFYVATNGVTATAVMNNRDAPYPITNLTVNPPLIATQQGDFIEVLPGNYYLSNNAPLRIAQGVTLEGVGMPIFHVDTNGLDAGRLDFSTFQPKDNCVIRGIVWEATNTWNTTDAGGHPYASFLMSGQVFTNVLVENCTLQGGSDVFYTTNTDGANFKLTAKRCLISSFWDLFSTSNGKFVSIENTWVGLGAQSRPTRINNGGVILVDSGSAFVGFAGMDASHGINGPFFPHGTIFTLTTPSENFIAGSAATLGGDYYDVVTGKTFSIGPEQAQWYTNAFTTNIVYSFNLTNVYVTAGSPNANVNGTYVLGTTDGNFSSGLSFWTNQSHATYVLRLNDPADTALEGGPPTAGIYNGNTSVALGAPFTITGMTTAGANIFSLGDGDTSCTAAFQTNSITTNRANVFVPSIFNLSVVFATNTIWAASGKYYGGDGRYLTNLTLVTTDWHTNGNTGLNPQSFIGTTDATDFKVKSGGSLVGYFDTNNSVWIGQFNTNVPGAVGNFIGGGLSNRIGQLGGTAGNYNTIQGGLFNSIGTHQFYDFIGGGFNNVISNNNSDGGVSAILAGQNNSLGNGCLNTSILWGNNNQAYNTAIGGAAGGSYAIVTNQGAVLFKDGNSTTRGSIRNHAMILAFAGGVDIIDGPLVVSNKVAVDVTHAFYPSNATASSIATIGADNTLTNLNAINAGTALQLTGNQLKPITTEILTNGASQNVALGAGLTNISTAGITYNALKSPTNATFAPDFRLGSAETNIGAAFTLSLPINVDPTLTFGQTTIFIVRTNGSGSSPFALTTPTGARGTGTAYVTNTTIVTVFAYGKEFTNYSYNPIW